MKNYSLQLRNGDILFQKNNFNIKDVNTYLSPIIYFGINFWNRILDKPLCPVHHCGVLFLEYSTWYVYEAKSKGIVKTKLEDKLTNKDITTLIVKRYPNLTTQDGYVMKLYADSVVNKVKYDGWSIVLQFFKQLFNSKIDLATNPNKFKNKKMNCCEFVGEDCKRVGITFNRNIKSLDPNYLYFDDRSDFIMFLK
jgi:hypothetical protein